MSNDLVLALLLFAGSTVLVILSGVFLAKYGDAIAELMGWGRLWVGTILVALATSLPELVTNVTAAIRDQPELAGGTILGANMVNMFTLAMVALFFGAASFFRQVAPEQRYLVLIAISLTALAVLLSVFPIGVAIQGVGLASLLILALYLGGMRLVYVTLPKEVTGPADSSNGGLPSLGRAWAVFGLASLGVMVAAPALAFSVEEIAESTGLATSFLGVVAVALVTTMPEASTTITAVRIGATDLAVGNLFGSCAFNILILALRRSRLPARNLGGNPGERPCSCRPFGNRSHDSCPLPDSTSGPPPIYAGGAHSDSHGPRLYRKPVRRLHSKLKAKLKATNRFTTISAWVGGTACDGLRWTPKFGQVAKRESRS